MRYSDRVFFFFLSFFLSFFAVHRYMMVNILKSTLSIPVQIFSENPHPRGSFESILHLKSLSCISVYVSSGLSLSTFISSNFSKVQYDSVSGVEPVES